MIWVVPRPAQFPTLSPVNRERTSAPGAKMADNAASVRWAFAKFLVSGPSDPGRCTEAADELRRAVAALARCAYATKMHPEDLVIELRGHFSAVRPYLSSEDRVMSPAVGWCLEEYYGASRTDER
jgi:hypothetical protein